MLYILLPILQLCNDDGDGGQFFKWHGRVPPTSIQILELTDAGRAAGIVIQHKPSDGDFCIFLEDYKKLDAWTLVESYLNAASKLKGRYVESYLFCFFFF